jgi:8-oxo-dGTP pyrophosphatase MutT (NUDIX family)
MSRRSRSARSAHGARVSAVLVALFEEAGQARVILTRRSTALRAHRGEVSFPGGRIEAGEDAPAAARREAHEEIGLDPAASEVVGWLHPLHTVASTSFITPVVVRLAERPRVSANPAEVERVFDVSLAALVGDGAFFEERWRIARELLPESLEPGAVSDRITVWFFHAAGEIVWGATARMLHELMAVVLGVAAGSG